MRCRDQLFGIRSAFVAKARIEALALILDYSRLCAEMADAVLSGAVVTGSG